ncbi:MAG: hypothetical protein Q8O75_01600 [bacterium]|nr:hypothetical protein [bacterium]
MKRIEFDENSKLADILNSIKETSEKELEIFVFPGSEALKLSANIDAINHFAEKEDKKVVVKGDFGKEIPKEEVRKEVSSGKEENLGFVEGADVARGAEAAKSEQPALEKKSKFTLPKIPSLGFLKGKKWVYFAAGSGVVLVIVLLGVFWFVPQATVKLITEPQFKEAELTLVASTSADEVDLENGTVPLKILDTTQEDVTEAKSTGTKTVGTQSKGRVKIINRETKDKIFFAGTTIKTLSNPILTFTLDDTATISASPVACTNDCKETAVNVTAAEIGDAGNLAAGTKFQVGSVIDTTKVVAEGLTNFTGGSSKKLTVVSSDDQKKAKDELMKKLETKAKEALEKENTGIVIPEDGLSGEIINEIYSKKVGEEANDFRLSLQVKFTAKSFSEDDLKNLLIKSISQSVPSGYVIDRDSSTVKAEILEQTGESLKVLGKIKASLVPDVDKQKIKKNIAGKDFGATDKYLRSIESISGFEIKITPSVFRVLGFMPFLTSKIKVEIIQKE